MKGAGEPAVDKSTAESSSTGNDGALDKAPSQPPQETSKSSRRSNTKESSGTSGRSKKGSSGQDKEMMDFRHLMVKGLELKKYKGSTPSEKCVIYMDVTCRTFFCAKQKNASNAKAYRVEDIVEANANGSNEKIICMVHNDGQLDLEVSSPKVQKYLVRMLNKLFTLEKNRTDSNDTLPSGKSKTNRGSSGREKKNSRRNKSNRGDDDDDVGRRGGRIQVSQVKLLAEHCYSIGDDKIEEVGIIFSMFFFFKLTTRKYLAGHSKNTNAFKMGVLSGVQR